MNILNKYYVHVWNPCCTTQIECLSQSYVGESARLCVVHSRLSLWPAGHSITVIYRNTLWQKMRAMSRPPPAHCVCVCVCVCACWLMSNTHSDVWRVFSPNRMCVLRLQNWIQLQTITIFEVMLFRNITYSVARSKQGHRKYGQIRRLITLKPPVSDSW